MKSRAEAIVLALEIFCERSYSLETFEQVPEYLHIFDLGGDL